MTEQISLFDYMLEPKKITKPIRLIELFAGIGSQLKALKQVTPNVEHYKICEWAYPSICAYNAIHIKDFKSYSAGMSKDELIHAVEGISINYNSALTIEQLKKKPLEWLKNAYNNIRATNNLVDIMRVHGKDLEIREREIRVHTHLFLPVPRPQPCGTPRRDVNEPSKRRNTKWTTVGSGPNPRRTKTR